MAKSVDSTVATNISSIAEGYIEKRKWYEAAGDWIYNTFCVDLANHFSIMTIEDVVGLFGGLYEYFGCQCIK